MEKWSKQKFQKGFTIVELLIVIVVVGILAAIVITSFSGTQQRARNAATVTSAVSWRKAISAYKAVHGYPVPSSGQGVCLSLNMPAEAGLADGACSNNSSFVTTDPSFNQLIATVSQVSPKNDYPIASSRFGRVEFKYRGVFYTTNGNDGYISYFVKGDARDCGPGTTSQIISITYYNSTVNGTTTDDSYVCTLPIN